MVNSWQYFLILLIVSLLIQGFFSMMEMACVSFNKVRLQYYVSKKSKRAKWLGRLLNHPAHLFGTTLIGVNTALQFGSECGRRLYASLGLSPDWAMISQVFIVLIFAELVPMFAARRCAENVTMLGIFPLYITSILLRPFTAILSWVCRFVHFLFRIPITSNTISREELQKAIEERDERGLSLEKKKNDPVLMNIFSLKAKRAKDLMEPLKRSKLLSSYATVGDLRSFLKMQSIPFVPLFDQKKERIISIAYPRDLLRFSEDTPLRSYARAPWFITEKNSILEIIKEFRRNNQSLAIVLNASGLAVGILTLDAIVDEIFGERDDWASFGEFSPEKHRILLDRSFPSDTKVCDINLWFNLSLPGKEEESLEGLMSRFLKRRVEKGESVKIQDLEFTLDENSFAEKKTITIRSL